MSVAADRWLGAPDKLRSRNGTPLAGRSGGRLGTGRHGQHRSPRLGGITDTYDVAVVGAGLIGLATAYQLQSRRPDLKLAVVDKEAQVGAHQSSHNSGVLHSGVYYAPGSMKARLCVRGKELLESFAHRHGIPFERCGKVIVAAEPSELERLAVLRERAVANGVANVRELSPSGLREVEPHAVGIKALHVPGTAIIDFQRVATAVAGEVVAQGGDLLLGRRVETLAFRGGLQVLTTKSGDIAARHVICCAGLHADRVKSGGAAGSPRLQVVPFRGSYYQLHPSARHLVRGLIYPVPDPALPFLGVHFTKRVDGAVLVGPTAVLGLGREAYRRTSINLRDTLATLAFPGLWRLARRHWRTGIHEVVREFVRTAYVKDLQRYVPAIGAADLLPGPSGVRAQALRSDGIMVDDFSFVDTARVIHVQNAPSPGATASLAIGDHLAELAIRRFDLPPHISST